LRLALAPILCLALAACAAQYHPPGPGPAEPRLAVETALAPAENAAMEPGDEASTAPVDSADAVGELITDDGLVLPLRVWRTAEAPKAVMLALHGFNDYSRAFDLPAPVFAAAGIQVYAYDQRGFGETAHPGLWAGSERLAADLRTAVALLRRRHPERPLILLGESMGGAVVLYAGSQAPPLDVDAVVLVAPAVWARETQPWYQSAALWLALQIAPGWRPSGQGLQIQASDNIPMLRAFSRDPLVLNSTRIDTLAGLVDLMDEALAAGPVFAGPTLMLYGAKDQVVPPGPTARLWHSLPDKSQQRLAYYENGWHMLLRDLEADLVIGDIIGWSEDRQAPLASGAEWNDDVADVADVAGVDPALEQ
jgi:alpha-beta hydrolase superfamily lysophospholipase